jgi:hypothetical protein
MFVRISTLHMPSDKIEQGIRFMRETAIPRVRDRLRPGLKNGYWCLDRKTGKAVVVTFWESEEAERATSAAAAQLRSEAEAAIGSKAMSVETFEVVGHI